MFTNFFKDRQLIHTSNERLPENETARDAYLNTIKEHLGADHWTFSEEALTPGQVFIATDGRVVDAGSRPAPMHRINMQTLRWEDGRSAEAVLEAKLKALDSKREELSSAPLLVGTILLDADEIALNNLKSKLEVVQQRVRLNLSTPSEYFIWRDANNVTHHWNSLQTYYDWLTQFAIALEERNTLLYVRCWQLKEALRTRYTSRPTSVYQFNTDAGW